MASRVRFLNPATLAPPPGYSYVVETIGPGRTIYLAGQLGLDADNRLLGAPGDFRAQCIGAFENLKRALAAVGASFNDVVKINNYIVDMANIGTFREVRDTFVNTAAPPASTTVAVPTLARPGALFEVEAIAVLPAKAPARTKTSAARPAQRRSPAKAKPTQRAAKRPKARKGRR